MHQLPFTIHDDDEPSLLSLKNYTLSQIMPHRVGDEIELTIENKYIEPTPAGASGKVFYAPDSDVMNFSYDYFIFDAAAYVAKFGGPTNGGTAKVRIDDVAPSVTWHSNPYPAGPCAYGFNYYHVTLV